MIAPGNKLLGVSVSEQNTHLPLTIAQFNFHILVRHEIHGLLNENACKTFSIEDQLIPLKERN